MPVTSDVTILTDRGQLQVPAWVRERLADHAAPKVVEFVDALPRNALGKTDKQALRSQAARS
jgi:acyl-coenzyme A synthetase/AMP-(fatty) acid ligase